MADEVKISDLIPANYIALAWQEAANANPTDYLGSTLFGFKKQMDLDLRWIKGASGLPVALKPSTWDAEVPLRGRVTFNQREAEMPLFREGIQLAERDMRDLEKSKALGNDYLLDAMSRVFNDTNTLVRAAKLIPEIMTWQLLAPVDGKPKIAIADNNVSYAYNYDPNGEWYAKNFTDGSSTPWSSAATATPIDDLRAVVTVAKARGALPRYGIMSQKTMTELLNTAQVKSAALAQNVTANVFMTEDVAKNVIESLTGVRPIVYNAVYSKDGAAATFFPDGVVTLVPEGLLGNMVYAMTSEEFATRGNSNKRVSIVDNSIAISVVTTSEMPPRTTVYASEIVLPSYERMDEVYEIKVDADPTEE